MIGCPRCNSSKTEFRRERIGTSSKSTGKGRNYTSQSNTSYRTVGFCKECGYTWITNGSSQSSGLSFDDPAVMFVLLLVMFPIPVTVWVSRSKKIKPLPKIGIIVASWIIYFLIVWFGGVYFIESARKYGESHPQ